MSNYWNIPGVPHRGWTLVDVIDIREDGQSEDETDYQVCMMCGNEKIRYVHVLAHPDIAEQYSVGCVCAEKMTDDYINPAMRERNLRNKSSRRTNWLKRKWQVSAKGNFYLNLGEHNVSVFFDNKTNAYKCRIDDKFGTLKYASVEEAKMGLFKKIEDLKDKGEW